MKILFATHNNNKVLEVSKQMPEGFELVSLDDLGIHEEIPETSDTLEGNALQKAHYLSDKYQLPIISDDTGLEIEALNGEPGVYSARYAGEDKNAEKNMDLVLEKLTNSTHRKAQFKTVIAFIFNGKQYIFEGVVKGDILKERQGEKGFGYDPIFQPEGYSKSFAQFSVEEKNAISHRGRAVKKLIDFINTI
jgi:XTP/dITP diphosphohydrolase